MTDVPNICLLWTDIETTGLDYESDLILEIAYQITDYLGEPLSPLQSAIVIDHEDDEQLGAVLDRYLKAAPAVKQMHRDNGLWNEVLFGGPKDGRGGFFEVIDDMLSTLDDVRGDAEVRLAGSTVSFDKRFLETVFGGELPISHRVHDLSTLRPLFEWQGIDLNDATESLDTGTHRAAADVERDVLQWQSLIHIMLPED